MDLANIPPEDQILPWWVGYDSLLAVGAFLVFNRWVSLVAAIVAVTLVGVVSAVLRVRLGLALGVLLPVVIIAVLIRGIIGIITDNEDVYLGIGIFYKYCIAAGVVASVLLRWRFIDVALRRTLGLDAATCALPEFRKPVDRTLVAFGIFLAASASFDIWLLGETSANSYILLRLLINWPLYILIAAFGLYWLGKSLKRVPGFPGMMVLLEAQARKRMAGKVPPERAHQASSEEDGGAGESPEGASGNSSGTG